MIARTLSTAVAALIFCVSVFAQEKSATPIYFEQEVKDSNPLRTEQAKELDEYILALKTDNARLRKLVPNDYSSPQAFEKSAQGYRQAFCDSIGYPPPGDVSPMVATFKQIGEDGIGTYFRAMIPILPGVHAEGIYIVPKSLKTGEKGPLAISMHGGGGSPEVGGRELSRHGARRNQTWLCRVRAAASVLGGGLSERRSQPYLAIHADDQKSHTDELLPVTREFGEWLLAAPATERHGLIAPLRTRNGNMTLATASRLISDVGRAANVIVDARSDKAASAHDIRRLFVTDLLRRFPPAIVQKLSRHDNIATTMTYYEDLKPTEIADEVWGFEDKKPKRNR